jgi:hypothetical protein
MVLLGQDKSQITNHYRQNVGRKHASIYKTSSCQGRNIILYSKKFRPFRENKLKIKKKIVPLQPEF